MLLKNLIVSLLFLSTIAYIGFLETSAIHNSITAPAFKRLTPGMCPTCNGEGLCKWCNGESVTPCRACNGSGRQTEGDNCDHCGGKGKVDCNNCYGGLCRTCNGSGQS